MSSRRLNNQFNRAGHDFGHMLGGFSVKSRRYWQQHFGQWPLGGGLNDIQWQLHNPMFNETGNEAPIRPAFNIRLVVVPAGKSAVQKD